MTPADRLARLQEITGHNFASDALAIEALTHTSFAHEHPGAPHNERLEFVGDAVVNLAATVLLAEADPSAAEGELTFRRQHLVNTLTLGDLGRELGLHRLILLGRGEATKAHPEPTVVGCAVEAILGAIYTEAGFDTCLEVCRRWFQPRLAVLQAGPRKGIKDYKSRLQEFTQARWKETPQYVELGKTGPDHALLWRYEVRVRGETLAEGEAPKKDDAMKAAAGLALQELERRESVERA
jgi:ribonuclease-3